MASSSRIAMRSPLTTTSSSVGRIRGSSSRTSSTKMDVQSLARGPPRSREFSARFWTLTRRPRTRDSYVRATTAPDARFGSERSDADDGRASPAAGATAADAGKTTAIPEEEKVWVLGYRVDVLYRFS